MDLFQDSDDDVVPSPRDNIVLEAKVGTAKPSAKKKTKSKSDDGAPRVDKRSVKDEKSRQEMLERLEKNRVLALEARLRNKAVRDATAKEEKDKVEKVASYLKNDDLFEKKYADKFAKITDMLTNVETHLSEVKDLKKKKQTQRDEDRAIKAKTLELVKDDLMKLQLAENKIIEEDTKAKMKVEAKTVDASIIKGFTPAPLLPNYRNMTFGKRIKGKF